MKFIGAEPLLSNSCYGYKGQVEINISNAEKICDQLGYIRPEKAGCTFSGLKILLDGCVRWLRYKMP